MEECAYSHLTGKLPFVGQWTHLEQPIMPGSYPPPPPPLNLIACNSSLILVPTPQITPSQGSSLVSGSQILRRLVTPMTPLDALLSIFANYPSREHPPEGSRPSLSHVAVLPSSGAFNPQGPLPTGLSSVPWNLLISKGPPPPLVSIPLLDDSSSSPANIGLAGSIKPSISSE